MQPLFIVWDNRTGYFESHPICNMQANKPKKVYVPLQNTPGFRLKKSHFLSY